MLSVMVTAMVSAPATTTTDRRHRLVVSMRATAVDSEGGRFEISLIAFHQAIQARLLKLGPGDEVSVVGHASINKWDTAHNGVQVGLNVIVRRLLTHEDAGRHLLPEERPMGPLSAPEGAVNGGA